ncbi:MAG: response regulator [Eubacteriales bacterium]|nr:response regulator [Eubacteriales bacterium]
MLIGLCDDSRTWCEFATAVLEDFLKENGWDAELISFAGSRELLEEYTGSIPDILFLDIELEEERDGISLAKEINLRYPECQIVFLTDYLYYAVDIFETKHAYFVLKEQFEDRLPEIFHKLMYRLDQSCQRLVFSVAWGREMLVKPSEMLFLERDMRHTIVHTLWGDFQVKEKLDELMLRV